MRIKKMKVGTFNLKKYLFLYIKGHLNNGLTLGQIDDKLEEIVREVSTLFIATKYQFIEGDIRKKYPYAFDKDGNQIGCKKEEYKDERR